VIIDIHTRIGQHPLHEFKQTPEELLAIMDEHGIDKSFLLPFPTIVKVKENNDMIAKAVKEHPDRFIGLAGIDPSAEDVLEEVPERAKHRLPVLFNTENIRYAPYEPYYKGLDQLAFKFPDVRLIVNKRWPRLAELMRIHRNIIVYTAGHHNVPGIIPFIEELGPTRMCLGSESPVNHPALIIRDIKTKKIAPVYRELILGKNAERLFKDLF